MTLELKAKLGARFDFLQDIVVRVHGYAAKYFHSSSAFISQVQTFSLSAGSHGSLHAPYTVTVFYIMRASVAVNPPTPPLCCGWYIATVCSMALIE